MAEALVTIAAEGILKKVLSIAASELAIAWGYQEKLTGLHRTLDLLRAKLRDAEKQKGTEVVMVWLKQLKDVVGEADEVLDEVQYEMLRRQIKKRDRMTRKVDINTLLAKIYESVAGKKPTSDLRVNLIKSLEEKLASKRYLLILDDVWVEDKPYWEDFRSCMLNVNSQNGSGVLVTTRKHEIRTHDIIIDLCHLEGLSNDVCYSIFRERAFVAGKSPSQELDEIGREIAKKCHGLPLLLNIIGSMLANHIDDREKWLSIKNNKVWDLEKETDRVQKSLELSFDDLPNSIVKQCFAYCSIFKKDTVMRREELIQLWMALGLVQADEERNKDMEDVGNDIFQILVNNSLFQDVTRDLNGHIICCCMHDLVHDFLLSLRKHEILYVDVGAINNDDDIPRVPHVKHLGFYQEKTKVSFLTESHMAVGSLYTLFFKGEVEKNVSFQGFKYLRILKLRGCRMKKIDDSVGELVHLRYLDLSETGICSLPESIGKLYQLQTLHLYTCNYLKEFPKSMGSLISLRHFKSDKNIPANILGKMISLRNLYTFNVVRKKGHGIENLCLLNNLSGTLRIRNIENVTSKEDAVKADLSGKKKLYEIEFSWSSKGRGSANKNNDEDVFESLQPPEGVKILKVENFSGDNIPKWVTKMTMLVSITLSYCSSCLSLPTLEHLPHLCDLVLKYMDNLTCLRTSCLGQLGDDATAAGSVKPLSPSLRSLKVSHMKSLEKWIDGATNSSKMISPVLERLEIECCPKFTLLDEFHAHPLVSLKIWDSTCLVSIKSIQGLTSLTHLDINLCRNLLRITSLPNQCHSLETLVMTHCHKLTSLPHKMFDSFPCIKRLVLGPFSKQLDSFPSLQGIDKVRNHLQVLQLSGWDHWESIPQEIQHLTSLTRLFIKGFGLRELPTWLINMSSIRHITFISCNALHEAKVKVLPPEVNVVFNIDVALPFKRPRFMTSRLVRRSLILD